jgi:hypothetical protein
MSEPAGIVASVRVLDGSLESRDMGEHRFAVIPRVGEHIWIADFRGGDGEHYLKVIAITHFSDAAEESGSRLKLVPTRSIELACEAA